MKRTPSGVQVRVGIMLLQCTREQGSGVRDRPRQDSGGGTVSGRPLKTFSTFAGRDLAVLRRVVWLNPGVALPSPLPNRLHQGAARAEPHLRRLADHVALLR